MRKYDFMQLATNRLLSKEPMVCTIGVFDGLHLGHQKIVSTCVSQAHEKGCKSMAVTFNRNPKEKLGNHVPFLLSSYQKEKFLSQMGVDYLVIIDFSSDISKLTGTEFLHLLGLVCTLKGIVVGKDFRCGTPASCAGCEQLQEYLSRHGSGDSLVIPPYVRLDDGERVSSSLIRQKLKTGDFPMVEKMLGRPYSLDVRHVVPKSLEGGLWYSVKDIGQLLPPEGSYRMEALMADGSKESVMARLTMTELMLGAELSGHSSRNIEELYFTQR